MSSLLSIYWHLYSPHINAPTTPRQIINVKQPIAASSSQHLSPCPVVTFDDPLLLRAAALSHNFSIALPSQPKAEQIIQEFLIRIDSDIQAMLIAKMRLWKRLSLSFATAAKSDPLNYGSKNWDITDENFKTLEKSLGFNNDLHSLSSLTSLPIDDLSPLPVIFIVTSTIQKPQQKADLIRLSQTLMLVPFCHWIVVEDGTEKRQAIKNLLQLSGISHTHLFAETPVKIKEGLKIQPYRPRGSVQRNQGIYWLREVWYRLRTYVLNTPSAQLLDHLPREEILGKGAEGVAEFVLTRLRQKVLSDNRKINDRVEDMLRTVLLGSPDVVVTANETGEMGRKLLVTDVNDEMQKDREGKVRNNNNYITTTKESDKINTEGRRLVEEPDDESFSTGVVYFADDDNSYHLQIFEEMRYIKRVGVWPVGLVGGLYVERPLVDPRTGRISKFQVFFGPNRPFPLDMAGFAVNTDLLLSVPEAEFKVETNVGLVETSLLKHLVTRDQLEPLADNCTKVYVWHTKTQTPELQYEKSYQKYKNAPSNLGIEV
ncbi:unnamed protein product [Gordionus sp. m RMFG-2023]